MKKTLLLLLLPGLCSMLPAKEKLDSLFTALDAKIKNKDVYIEQKERRINEIKFGNKKVPLSTTQLYILNNDLYNEYKSYMSDSAIYYLNKNLDIAYALRDGYKINETSIASAVYFSTLGMYKEALDLIERVNPDYFDTPQRIKYYQAYRYIYAGLGSYTHNIRDKSLYWRQANVYRDTIMAITDKESEDYLRIKESSLRENNQLDEALKVNDKRLALTYPNTAQYALATFGRSLIYRKKEDTEMEKSYLILSAISDIQLAIKDNASISILAGIEMKEGNIDRAYKYIRFSLDNINDYNTRIRSSEVLNIQTIIDKAYNQASEKQKSKLQLLLLLISILSILLTVSVCYVYLQMKKRIRIGKQLQESNTELNKLNQKLSDMNNELKKINLEIKEANHVKEEYIGYFLDECSKYIEKLDQYRKMVNKRLKEKEINELYRITQNNNFKEEELKELFRNFDVIFMHLFPDFIDEFNSLLLKNEKIIPKKGEGLTTELRIYALIRLGLDDNSKIANFLGYSINTIYNYRAKMRNKSSIPKEDFEWTVRRIGTFIR
jgi:hypothetical protein